MELTAIMLSAAQALRARFSNDESNLSIIVDLTTLVASADGVIDEAEQRALAVLVSSLLDSTLAQSVVDRLVGSSISQSRELGATAHARFVARSLVAHGVIEEALTLALSMAYVNGEYSEAEQRIIGLIAKETGAAPQRLDALVAAVRASAGGV